MWAICLAIALIHPALVAKFDVDTVVAEADSKAGFAGNVVTRALRYAVVYADLTY